MGTKNNPGNFDCYANADPDEPMFVLLGRDPIGGALVRLWAASRPALNKPGDAAKIAEATACADAMDAWCKHVGREPRSLGSARVEEMRTVLAAMLAHGVFMDDCARCDELKARARAVFATPSNERSPLDEVMKRLFRIVPPVEGEGAITPEEQADRVVAAFEASRAPIPQAEFDELYEFLSNKLGLDFEHRFCRLVRRMEKSASPPVVDVQTDVRAKIAAGWREWLESFGDQSHSGIKASRALAEIDHWRRMAARARGRLDAIAAGPEDGDVEPKMDVQADTARLDWLENEMEREARTKNPGACRSLFRRNVPITRAAIDEAMADNAPKVGDRNG